MGLFVPEKTNRKALPNVWYCSFHLVSFAPFAAPKLGTRDAAR